MTVSPRQIAQNLMSDDERLIPCKDHEALRECENFERLISEKERYCEEVTAAIANETEEDTQFKLMTLLCKTTENASALKERLAQYKSAITIKPEDFPTVAELRKQIKKHPLIKPRTKVQIGRFYRQYWVSFTTKPIVLRPSNNPHKHIDDGQIPYVHLGSIVTTISLNSGEMFVFSPSRNSVRKVGFRNQNVLHPHQVSKNKVCLGDFKSIFLEVIQTGDVMMLLDAVKLFFEQAYDRDPAGKHWTRWVVPNNFSPYTITPEGVWPQKIITSPDKPAEVVRGENLSETYVPNSTPPQRIMDVWDGISPLRTGHVVYSHSHRAIRHICCIDGETYFTYYPPAQSIEHEFFKLHNPSEVRTPTADEIAYELRNNPDWVDANRRYQVYWQMYDHEGHTPKIDPRPRVLLPRHNNRLIVRRKCALRLRGPMSAVRAYCPDDMITAAEYECLNDIVVQQVDPLPVDDIVFYEAGEPPLIGQWVCGEGMIVEVHPHTVLIANGISYATPFIIQRAHLPTTATPTMNFITQVTKFNEFKAALAVVRRTNVDLDLVDPRMRDIIFEPSLSEVRYGLSAAAS